MKPLKNLIKAASIAGILTLASVAAPQAEAQTPQALPFLARGGGGPIPSYNGYLQMATQTTNSYGATNVYAQGSFTTNMTVTITNASNGLVINGYVSTNFPVWKTNTSAISDVNLWGNRDGTAPLAAISVDINGSVSNWFAGGGPNFTNMVTFNFALEPVGGALPCTAAQNLWSFSILGNGNSDVVVSTNLPTGFLQGGFSLRLLNVASITVGTGAGTNGQVVGVWLCGYKPDGGSGAQLMVPGKTFVLNVPAVQPLVPQTVSQHLSELLMPNRRSMVPMRYAAPVPARSIARNNERLKAVRLSQYFTSAQQRMPSGT